NTKARLKVIIIDDGYTSQTEPVYPGHYPWLTIIKNKYNLDFVRSVNKAYQTAIKIVKNISSTYLLILNDDTLITPGAIDKLLQTLKKDRQIGMIGPEQADLTTWFYQKMSGKVDLPYEI